MPTFSLSLSAQPAASPCLIHYPCAPLSAHRVFPHRFPVFPFFSVFIFTLILMSKKKASGYQSSWPKPDYIRPCLHWLIAPVQDSWRSERIFASIQWNISVCVTVVLSVYLLYWRLYIPCLNTAWKNTELLAVKSVQSHSRHAAWWLHLKVCFLNTPVRILCSEVLGHFKLELLAWSEAIC